MTTIPKIIHQTSKDVTLPSPCDELAETWKVHHPLWEYKLWSDEMNREFIKEHYPSFLFKYDSYPREIQRVDAFRYCVLSKMGGVYIDIDFECLENIEILLIDQTCVIGKEPSAHCIPFKKDMILCNAWMACAPGDKFMNHVCERVMALESIQVEHNIDVLKTTGPFMLTDCYLEYESKKDVKILESGDLYPITMWETRDIIRNNMSDEVQARIDKAYAVHYFFGTW